MADETLEEPLSRKKSIKGYASKVFKESSVSAVSAIVSTGSTPRKVFRVLVFLLFTVGFLYQCIKFLSYILEYPTIVNIVIVKPDFFLTPAYTFCNYNEIKRSKFCTKYPEKCINADDSFCRMYPFYCGINNTKIPKEEYFLKQNMPEDNYLELGHDLEDFLKSSKGEGDEKVTGPYQRSREQEGLKASRCYSIHARVDSHLDPLQTHRKSWLETLYHEFVFDPEEDNLFNPNARPGMVFSIHSPFDAVNPFERGIYMKPGYLYNIAISMQEEKLLPYPYKTDCMNYTDIWVKNGRSGPRSQEMCRELCTLEMSHYCFNCTHESILYPSEVKFCRKDEIFTEASPCTHDFSSEGEKQLERKLENCVNKCKDDCLKMKYTYQVQETYIVPKWTNRSVSKDPRMIKVKIEFEDSEIIALHYRPQFQEVEAFSYIGGFIGIWLGVSLVQVADVFESLFRIARYFFRKGVSVCSKTSKVASNHEEV